MAERCCSFCGKSEKDVYYLVAGIMAFICETCVAFSSEIVWEMYQKRINEFRRMQEQLEQPALSRSKTQGGL